MTIYDFLEKWGRYEEFHIVKIIKDFKYPQDKKIKLTAKGKFKLADYLNDKEEDKEILNSLEKEIKIVDFEKSTIYFEEWI